MSEVIHCKHCNKEITTRFSLWVDDSMIFPQYCVVDMDGYSRLHAPKEKPSVISTEKETKC